MGGLTGAAIGSYMDQQEAELRAQLQGTGVSAWSNPWGDKRPFFAPTGMAIQFLGMNAAELGKLREFCPPAAP